MIAPSFLDTESKLSKQTEFSKRFKNRQQEVEDVEMPYFDYLREYLGLDRENPPEAFERLYQWRESRISDYSWDFNEIIYYSLEKETPNNEWRTFYGQPAINLEDCKTLCKLIVLYGGEQQNTTNLK